VAVMVRVSGFYIRVTENGAREKSRRNTVRLYGDGVKRAHRWVG